MPNKTSPSEVFHRYRHAIALGVLFLLAVFALGSPLFNKSVVLSSIDTDTAAHMLPARALGFSEMARGHLTLWNPFTYGGAPFLGQLESALFYPPNLIFLLLPFAIAMNWAVALHVFLMGANMYFWGTCRKLHPVAACFAGAVAMLGGTFFLQIYAGHISYIGSMAWAPLIFLGIDAWLERRHAGWIFLSAAGATMQICAGHPQYVYYTAIVAGVYSLISLIGVKRPLVAALGLLAIYPVTVLFSAAQLFPALALASESVRNGGTTYEFASMFSLPPENLLTVLSPWLYGDMHSVPYWGRCYLWEMEVYPGLGVLILASSALTRIDRKLGIRFFIMIGVVVILALGAHTPIYDVLYNLVPGYSGFRGTSKFIYLAGMFLALLAGTGLDQWLHGQKPSRPLVYFWLGAGILICVAGLWLAGASSAAGSLWQSVMEAVTHGKESYLDPGISSRGSFMDSARSLSGKSLEEAGAALVMFSLLALAICYQIRAAWVFAVAAVADVFLFATSSVTSFELEKVMYKPIAEFLAKQNPDIRILNLFSPDSCMVLRREGIWGYDPSVLKRYAEFIAFSQNTNPGKASQYQNFTQNSPLLALLRCGYGFVPSRKGLDVVPMPQPFPRFFLVNKYRVLTDRDRILNTLVNPDFDLRSEVVLEQKPVPDPNEDSGKGESQIKIVGATTDQWVVDVTTDRAAILVMTDSYSRDWHATPLPDSVQTNYELLPADYAIRAIPLAAGHHLILISYTPFGFYQGILLSICSLTVALVLILRPALRSKLSFA